jgi:hypothetical protein
MPVSRKRKKKLQPPKPKSKLKLSSFSVKPEYFDAYKTAMNEAAKKSVSDFPATLKKVTDSLRTADPIGTLATFAAYGLHTTVSSTGVGKQTLLKDKIQQHHAELLQALVLTIPVDEWGAEPFTPDTMTIMFDTVPEVSETFLYQRILAAEGIEDKVEYTLLSLQERIRLHTQAVRNWGYFSHVVQISNDLYGALDVGLEKKLGFTFTVLIDLFERLIDEFERRYNVHVNILAKVLQGRTPHEMLELYYLLVPDLKGSAEEMLAALPPGITREGVMAVTMGHYDLRTVDCCTFSLDEIIALTHADPTVLESAMRAVSLAPGSLTDTKVEHLFLGNPVWEAPAIDLGTSFFVPLPQLFFSHVHRVMERLANEAGLKVDLENRRAQFLEQQLEAAMRKALPMAEITPSAKWTVKGEQFETDLLVVVDRTVLIAEAKSNRLTAAGLRGAPDRVKRHVDDMVIYPSVQSARLEQLILSAKSGDEKAKAIVAPLGITVDDVDQIIRFSVTLDDFSVLSSAESDLKEIGWLTSDHSLAPTILIADLHCIIDILDQPLLFLHYLSERVHLQKAFSLIGDELDFLGLYLETGFNIAGLKEENSTFSPTGMSAPIDNYYIGRDAGISVEKPVANLSKLFRDIIGRLAEKQFEGWTTIGLQLLASADPDEQALIGQKLYQLRKLVRRNYSDPHHINSLQVKPPEARKGRTIFYLFPEPLRDERKRVMEGLAAQLFHEEPDVESCVIFARGTEHWEMPFETILRVSRSDMDAQSSPQNSVGPKRT